MRPLKWTCKSTETLALELRRQGFTISADSVGRMLKDLGYSLQSNRKRFEGAQHPDRDAQFEYINESVEAFQARGCEQMEQNGTSYVLTHHTQLARQTTY